MNIDNKASSWKFWTQRRHIFTIMAFFGFFNIYSLRANMSIAIVAMTSARSSTNENGTTVYLDPEFSWDNKIQGYLLGSFFYGYITSQLLGGVLSKKFGGKWIFGGGIASTGFLTLISPWLAEWSVYALLVCRILMGVFEGLTYSSIYSLFTKWIPTQERCRVSSQAVSGSYTGAVFALMFLAYLAKVAGWRSIFWVSGSISLIWFIFWSYFISESPETDPRISDSELRYIHEQSFTVSRSPEITPIKWKNIVCSKAAWALNVAVFCESWGFYTLLTLLPKYFKDIYGFDISESGIVSALPYLALSIMIHDAPIKLKTLYTISRNILESTRILMQLKSYKNAFQTALNKHPKQFKSKSEFPEAFKNNLETSESRTGNLLESF
ncbi:unnamed protein product [Ceutorhynchus assimilis]|uniref:Major facilitator superfamily (MFS) profile domain-containing protein n=1 Tax=Ceutorhynchus assimilis TaxID=467358 RepID=A0A9N9QHE5_9CUCU|nr:unnamed protein product [Ceutorhynchus assimilis]